MERSPGIRALSFVSMPAWRVARPGQRPLTVEVTPRTTRTIARSVVVLPARSVIVTVTA